MKNDKKGRLFIGTSGWNYAHWRGPFYPRSVPPTEFLRYYQRFFDTVEVNKSFYRLLSDAEVAAWTRSVPPAFVFSVKGSRFLTHMLKLKNPARGLERFFSPIRGFGSRLGPVVFQLPPAWRCDVARFAAFISALPPRRRYAFEFREKSWFNGEIYAILRKRRAALCIYHLAGFESPREITAPFAYVRLHGPGGKYQGSYADADLRQWARWTAARRNEGRDVYIYFDNDDAGYAAADARRLRALTGGRPPSAVSIRPAPMEGDGTRLKRKAIV